MINHIWHMAVFKLLESTFLWYFGRSFVIFFFFFCGEFGTAPSTKLKVAGIAFRRP